MISYITCDVQAYIQQVWSRNSYNLALDTTKADAPCRLFAAVVTNSSTLQSMITRRIMPRMECNSHLLCRLNGVN